MSAAPAAPLDGDRQRAATEQLHEQLDYVHRYWLREFGCYPKGEDSMAIVGAIAALNEMASLPRVSAPTPLRAARRRGRPS